MIWTSIRLELAQTEEFPRGSPSRAYLLRLPLGRDGEIDRSAIARQPLRATVHRFWPSEPDRTGYISPVGRTLELQYDPAEHEATAPSLDGAAFRLGECINLVEPNGRRLPLRVAAIEEFA